MQQKGKRPLLAWNGITVDAGSGQVIGFNRSLTLTPAAGIPQISQISIVAEITSAEWISRVIKGTKIIAEIKRM